MLVMGLVLAQSLMAISTTGMLLYAKVSLLFNVLWECIVVVYIVYKHFDRSLHVRLLDPTCVQNFRPVPLTVFEIQGFKLKNKNDNNNDKKNWRNRLFAISPMFVVQFSPNFRYTYTLTLAIILWCQKWIITESKSVSPKFQMYRHNGPRPRSSLYLFQSRNRLLLRRAIGRFAFPAHASVSSDHAPLITRTRYLPVIISYRPSFSLRSCMCDHETTHT